MEPFAQRSDAAKEYVVSSTAEGLTIRSSGPPRCGTTTRGRGIGRLAQLSSSSTLCTTFPVDHALHRPISHSALHIPFLIFAFF
jgi:hypothetical protein